MYIYISVYIYSYLHIYIYIHTHKYVRSYLYLSLYKCIYVYKYIHIYICIYDFFFHSDDGKTSIDIAIDSRNFLMLEMLLIMRRNDVLERILHSRATEDISVLTKLENENIILAKNLGFIEKEIIDISTVILEENTFLVESMNDLSITNESKISESFDENVLGEIIIFVFFVIYFLHLYLFNIFLDFFPVVMSVLDWVCVFIRETIQIIDFVTHLL
jgi:hypothetical protein